MSFVPDLRVQIFQSHGTQQLFNEGIIMPRKVRGWYYNPPKQKVDKATKEEIKRKCDKFIESVFKPKFISSEPATLDESYVVDIYSKWRGEFIYFYAKCKDTRPQAVEPTYDWKLARIEHSTGENKYNLAYFRHTGKWWTIFYENSLEECFEAIEDMPHFHPDPS